MSLVEQAIARLRQQQAGAKIGSAELPPKARSREPVAETLEDTANLAKRLDVDINALRAFGDLPDEDKDRQFADHFRRIKRPLIEKALAESASGEPRIIMVASAVPGDGKTFTTINLALSMALERDVS